MILVIHEPNQSTTWAMAMRTYRKGFSYHAIEPFDCWNGGFEILRGHDRINPFRNLNAQPNHRIHNIGREHNQGIGHDIFYGKVRKQLHGGRSPLFNELLSELQPLDHEQNRQEGKRNRNQDFRDFVNHTTHNGIIVMQVLKNLPDRIGCNIHDSSLKLNEG